MSKTAILIEFGKEAVSVVELKNRASGLELIRYVVREIPQNGLNPSWLRSIWDQEHFSHNKVIFVLPNSMIKFKSVIVPSLPEDQLEAAVQIELENGTGRGEIYKIISFQKQDQMIPVKVVIAKNDRLIEHVHFLQEAGLEVLWSGIRLRGLQNFINFNSGYFDDPGEGAAYLDITEEQTEFGVINGTEIVYRRDFPSGLELIEAGNSDSLTDYLEEVRLSLASFKAVSETPFPSKVWLFGKVESISPLLMELKEEFKLNLYIPEKSKLTGVLTNKYTSELASLIGLALDEVGLSRLEPLRIYSFEQKEVKANQQKILMFAGLGLMGIILAGGLFLGTQASLEKEAKTNQWLSQKAGKINKLRQTEQTTNQNIDKIKKMEAWLANRGQELEFFRVLQENLPEGTKVTDLTIESGNVKDLLGVTPSVSMLLNKIKTVPQLQGLVLKGTITNSNEGEVFHLEGSIIPKEPVK